MPRTTLLMVRSRYPTSFCSGKATLNIPKESCSLCVSVKRYPIIPKDFNKVPPKNARIQPLITPIIIEDLIDLVSTPNEPIGFPRNPTSQTSGIENVNINEPYIPLISNSAEATIAMIETKKRTSRLDLSAEILLALFFTYVRFPLY